MNVYYKFCPNVFIAKCTESHEKGETILLETKYGNDHECIVFNKIGERDGFFYYSIVRADGYNVQERAKAKAERLQSWANAANRKSSQYMEASNESRDFLILCEPIKVGHYSEKRHRALIDRNWNRFGKSVEFSERAEQHESKAAYWERKSKDINLSMPESIEYYEFELETAIAKHKGMKDGTIKLEHSFSVTYANNKVKELTKKVELAKKLWGE